MTNYRNNDNTDIFLDHYEELIYSIAQNKILTGSRIEAPT